MGDTPSREQKIVLAILAAALLLMAALIALFWQPAPPRVVVMSTGPEDGAYHAYGKRYQQILARSGVQLVLKPSAGAVENLERLRTQKDGTTLALVQGGVVAPDHDHPMQSLGGVFLEPLWVFHRSDVALTEVSDLAGKRVAAGRPGSGNRSLVRRLVEQNFPSAPQPILLDIGGLAAAQALLAGEVDAAMFVSAPDGQAVQQLLRAPGITLLSFRRAEAYTRRFPYLTKVEVPEGAIDLALNIPPAETTLVAATASLLATPDIHPVIVDMVLGAAREVHGPGSVIWRPGDFPSSNVHEFALSPDAEVFYKSGPSMLQRYLPFWAVVWIQRLVFLGLPILAVGIPLLRFLPSLYRWGMRRRIYRWYGELAFIERAVAQGRGDRAEQLRRLDIIENRVNSMHNPPAFAGEAYALKMHLQMVRDLLRAGSDAASAAPGVRNARR